VTSTVFMLGAGFNRSIAEGPFPSASFGFGADCTPPLATDFFEVILASEKNRGRMTRWSEYDNAHIAFLLKYIAGEYGLGVEELRSNPLDLEAVMTGIEERRKELNWSPHGPEVVHNAWFGLLDLLYWYLTNMTSGLSHLLSGCGESFGKSVWDSSADVISFNYDMIAEEVIGRVSGHNTIRSDLTNYPYGAELDELANHPERIPDDELDASRQAWNANLAYGFEFAEVLLPIAGMSFRIDGSRYYRHPNNTLYQNRQVLKLHGSLNWMKVRAEGYRRRGSAEHRVGDILLESHPMFSPAHSPHLPRRFDEEQLEPVIVPPQLYKDFEGDPLESVWRRARHSLEGCADLIVVGYSFPETDERILGLLGDVFEDHRLNSLTVVDPSPERVLGIVSERTRFSGSVETPASLREFFDV